MQDNGASICQGGLKTWDEAGQPKAMNLGKGLLEIGVLWRSVHVMGMRGRQDRAEE